MNIVYLHGFASSGTSNTANLLRELLTNDNIIAPDIPVEPEEALDMLHKLTENLQPEDTIIVGTSMGGMYAQQMCRFRRILVNPAFRVSDFLNENIGKFVSFFSERKDGIKEFMITEELYDSFGRMENRQFDGYNGYNQENMVIALFGIYDNICNSMSEYCKYYDFYHEFEGGHRLNREIIVSDLLPLIEWMRNPEVPDLSEVLPTFDNIVPGDVCMLSDGSEFKVYEKGIGKRWFDEISERCKDLTMPDNRKAEFVFPKLPEDVNPETATLIFGNKAGYPPTVEYFGTKITSVLPLQFNVNGITVCSDKYFIKMNNSKKRRY